jgi:hypothetical protein
MKTTLESCHVLGVHQLKKPLRCARAHERGIDGFITIPGISGESKISYSFDYTPEFDYIVVQKDGFRQRIKLAESNLYFGPRSLFECSCGKRVTKLYLPPNTTEFKCRHCHNLIYELQKINRKTMSGSFLYKSNRMLKAMNDREGMRSIFYRGKFTKRVHRWLKLSGSVGMNNYVRDAIILQSAMNG